MKFPLLASSVSILLDNTRELELFQNFKTEAAVHSQALNIYVFIHLTATNTSRNIWEELQKIFLITLSENKENSYNGLQKFSHQRNLERETNYLHSVIRSDATSASVVRFYWDGFGNDGLLEFAALHHYSTGTVYLAVEYSRFWMRGN